MLGISFSAGEPFGQNKQMFGCLGWGGRMGSRLLFHSVRLWSATAWNAGLWNCGDRALACVWLKNSFKKPITLTASPWEVRNERERTRENNWVNWITGSWVPTMHCFGELRTVMKMVVQNTKMIRYGSTQVCPPPPPRQSWTLSKYCKGWTSSEENVYMRTLFYMQLLGPHGSPEVHLSTLG